MALPLAGLAAFIALAAFVARAARGQHDLAPPASPATVAERLADPAPPSVDRETSPSRPATAAWPTAGEARQRVPVGGLPGRPPATNEAAPEPKAQPAEAWRALLPSVDVVVYTTTWCPACRQAKAWLRSNGVAYQERDVESSERYAHMMRALNPRGSIPTFDVEGDVMVGFSPERFVAMRENAARKRAERWH